MNMCNITFEVPGLSTFVFKKSSEKHTLIFVVKSLKSFGWSNVGSASQTVDQNYFTIGPMYRVTFVVALRHSFTRMAVREQTLGNHPILFQYWTNVEYDWPALNQQWAATLVQHWTGIGWVGLHCVYQVHRIDAYTDLSAMVVEGIGLHAEYILVSSVLSIIISWTFRILTHDENQCSYVYKILGHFLSKAL